MVICRMNDVIFWRHDGHMQNERCDFLATSSADGENLIDDVVEVC